MRLLVTRPEPDAADTAAKLRALGHDVILRPMLELVFNPPPAGLTPESLVFTSRNGVRAVANWPEAANWRNLRVFAVGTETAALLREYGFSDVRVAAGDAEALVARIAEEKPEDLGSLLYPAPRDQAADLAGRLRAKGFAVERVEAYRTEPASDLGSDVTSALRNGVLDGALFFSARTAAAFVGLVARSGLATEAKRLACYALSEAAGAPLRNLAATVHVAVKPDLASLVALIPGAVRE